MSRTHCKLICSLQTALNFYDELEQLFLDEDLDDLDFDFGCATSHSKDVERDSMLAVKFLLSEYESHGEPILNNEPRHIWDMNNPLECISKAKDRLADQEENGKPIVLCRNLPTQNSYGKELPYWAGASDDEKQMALVPWPGLVKQVEAIVFERLIHRPDLLINSQSLTDWVRDQVFVVNGATFVIRPNLGLWNVSDNFFGGWSFKMQELYPDLRWGLQSWSTFRPEAALSNNLVYSHDADYDALLTRVIVSIVGNLDTVPTIYACQLAAIVWERFGLLLSTRDSHILFQACMRARDKSMTITDASDVLAVFKSRYNLADMDRSAYVPYSSRDRIAKIMADLALFDGPTPEFPGEPIPAVVDSVRRQHFRRYDISDVGLERLHCAGRGIEREDVSDEELAIIVIEDKEMIAERGCADAACVYHDTPWRPVDGMRSPYATARGAEEWVCVAHGQLELFFHACLRMPEAAYRNVRDHELSFVKKFATLHALVAISQPCQGLGCGTDHALLTHTEHANAGGVALSLCDRCAAWAQSSLKKQMAAIEEKAESDDLSVEDLPAAERIIRSPPASVVCRQPGSAPCESRISPSCLHHATMSMSSKSVLRNMAGQRCCVPCLREDGVDSILYSPEEALDILPMGEYFELVHNLKMAMASPREDRREAVRNACFIGDYAMSFNTAARLIRKHRVEVAEHMTEARLEKELRELFGKES